MNLNTESSPLNGKRFGVRHVQVILVFFGNAITMSFGTNLSVAMVAMTNNSRNSLFESFQWNESTKGLLLSSFFWGYLVTQFPASILTRIFGGKTIYLTTILGSSALTILIPYFAHLGWQYLFALRLLIGLFVGCLYPSIYYLLSNWLHPSERGLGVIVISGSQFGMFVVMAVSGEIAESYLGWPSIFYLSGGIGLVWSALYLWIGSDSPEKSSRITKIEKDFLQNSVEAAHQKPLPMPWREIFTSIPFLALIAVHCSANWGFFFLQIEIPSYMANILNFNIQSSAIISALPYLILLILGILLSPLSDFLINKNYLSRVASRKLFNSMAFWIPPLCLIGITLIPKESTSLAICFIVLAIGSFAGANAGFYLVFMDMSPNFASTLFGLSNTVANIFSLAAPIFTGFIVTDPNNSSLWQIVFIVTAVIYICGDLIFLIFGQASVQSWNIGRSV